MTNPEIKAKELAAQFGDRAKYVVSEVVDALKVTTGHLTIGRRLERQELQDDFNYWRDVKAAIEKGQVRVEICSHKKCNDLVYEFGECFRHYCISEHH